MCGRHFLFFRLPMVLACLTPAAGRAAAENERPSMKNTVRAGDLRIRDPFVVPVKESRLYLYYLFGTTDKNCWGPGGSHGFAVYQSRDLKVWSGPEPAFSPPKGFWADRNFWAPEVHSYRGRWYMFASFKSETRCRGTQILAADSVEGPYRVYSDGPVTPPNWECLDGTLWVDARGNPWIVFCHEWLQVHDGEICAQRLSGDLRRALGAPLVLFHGSDAPWAPHPPGKKDYVTDGPFLYRLHSGVLVMLWSSFGREGYAVGLARSVSGSVRGPWEQEAEPLFAKDGGHAMIFRTFEGVLMLALHQPNRSPLERPRFFRLEETATGLRLAH